MAERKKTTAHERLGGQLAELEGSLAVSDVTPPPVHLDKVVEALAGNPSLPPELVRRLFAHRRDFGSVAKRPDLTDSMVAEIIAVDDHWLTHSLALNRALPHAFRMTLTDHPDPEIRAAVVVSADGPPRELFERLLGDPDLRVREYLAQSDHVPTDLRARWRTTRSPRSGRRLPNGGRRPRNRCVGAR
ncbi:hypothetical protein [Streptomyces sp. NPDC050564]|uniref:hypothetical protein n=1 Tax=Streptomyces sp. NPDC050564 TaxID=3365631 RepID=UPI0037A8082B